MNTDFNELPPPEPVVADVLAFRSFRIDPVAGTLGGLTYHQEIGEGVNVACCANAAGHAAPQEGCTCGWYAYDEFRRWGTTAPPSKPVKLIPLHPTGIVRLSGKIIVCERGLKAENMEIIALAVHSKDQAFLRTAFPNVEFYTDEETMIASHPLTRLDRGDAAPTSAATTGQPAATVGGVRVPHWLTRNGPIAKHVTHTWGTLFNNVSYWEILRTVAMRTLLLTLIITGFHALGGAITNVYPGDSLGGFGALIPLGILVLLSPLLNLRRSLVGLALYIYLFNYGLVGSADAIEALIAAGTLTTVQVYTAAGLLYAVPLVLFLYTVVARISDLRWRITNGPGTPRAARMGTGPYRNRLPKNVKPTTSGTTHTEGDRSHG